MLKRLLPKNDPVSNLYNFFFHEFADKTSQSDRTVIAEFWFIAFFINGWNILQFANRKAIL